jgi:Xaa-Pro aminopeptidase
VTSVDECIRAKYTDLERVAEAVDSGPFDVVVCTSPENISYFSGFYSHDIRIFPERAHFAVWMRGRPPVFIVYQKRAVAMNRSSTFIDDVRGYAGEETDSMRVLGELLREEGLDKGVIGFELKTLPFATVSRFKQELPGAIPSDASMFLESIRMIKTQAEIDQITKIARITCNAIDTALKSTRAGDSERAISARIQHLILGGGADVIAAAFFGSGRRSGAFHHYATDVAVSPGDVIKIDCGGQMDGYFSDIARTVVVGRATAYQRDVHSRLTEIKNRIVDYIKPGVTGGEVFAFGCSEYKRLDLQVKYGMFGHSIGLKEQEAPQLVGGNDLIIEPNMTLMIETGFADPPRDSFAVEDLVLVDDRGARYLTDADAHSTIREIG